MGFVRRSEARECGDAQSFADSAVRRLVRGRHVDYGNAGIGGKAVCHCGHMGGLFGVFHASPKITCVAVFNTAGGGWEWVGDEISAPAVKAAAGKK